MMNMEAICPKCQATLHETNFTVTDSCDEEDAELHIDCWACTWTTWFRVKRFNAIEEDN